MVNLFPVLFLALLGHTVLRVFMGLTFIYLSFSHIGKNKIPLVTAISTGFPYFARLAPFIALKFAVFELVIGAMFLAGAYTQAAAIGGVVLSLKMLIFRKKISYPIVPSAAFWVMVLATSMSLFVTGAGAFAFDFPI